MPNTHSEKIPGNHPRRAIEYWHGALEILVECGFLAREGEAALSLKAMKTLAEAGYPALAMCGTQATTWLHRAGAFRRVLLAFDADEAGDEAAEKLAPILISFGARCERLRPEGAKDWNKELGRVGRNALADWLAAHVLVG